MFNDFICTIYHESFLSFDLKFALLSKPETLTFSSDLSDQVETNTPYQYQGRLFPDWEIRNLGAQIRQVKGRIIELEEHQAYVPPEPVFQAGCRIVEDVDDNRIHLEFDDKPDESVRSILKQHGFR